MIAETLVEIHELEIRAEVARIFGGEFLPAQLQLRRAVVALVEADELRLQIGTQPVPGRRQRERTVERGDRRILTATPLLDARELLQRQRAILRWGVRDEEFEMRDRPFSEMLPHVAFRQPAAQLEILRIELDRLFPGRRSLLAVASREPLPSQFHERVRPPHLIRREQFHRPRQPLRTLRVTPLRLLQMPERQRRQRTLRIECPRALKRRHRLRRTQRFAQQMPEHHLARERLSACILVD